MVRIIQPLLSTKEEEALQLILDYLEDERGDYATLPPEERPGHIYHSVLVLRSGGVAPGPTFELGKTCSTPGALAALKRAAQEPHHFLSRHGAGDWGDVSRDDWQENQLSLVEGFCRCHLLVKELFVFNRHKIDYFQPFVAVEIVRVPFSDYPLVLKCITPRYRCPRSAGSDRYLTCL